MATDFEQNLVRDLGSPEAYILHYAQRDLLNRSELSPGPNCLHPDRATYLLVQDIATKLGQNTEKDSLANFMYYFYKYKEVDRDYDMERRHTYWEKIRNKMKEMKFDINKMKAEVDAVFQEKKKHMEDPANKMSTCLTKRPDVWNRAEEWFSNSLFYSIKDFYFEKSDAPDAEPASEPASEGGKKKKGGNKSAKKNTKNLCLKKSTQKKSTKKGTKGKSKCESVKGCKIASGTKRTYCRKKHNKTHKKD